MEDLLLVVSSPPSIDLDYYQLWLDGNSLEDALQIVIKKNIPLEDGANSQELEFRRPMEHLPFDHTDLTRYEIKDNYCTFEMLERFLMHPQLLKNQTLVSISSQQHSFFIEKYWSLDDEFVREVLNKRLSRSRKELEDVSLNTGLPLRRIMRQFDNIKNLYNAYEESPNTDSNNNIYTYVARTFLLSQALSRKYSCIVFLLISKFNLTAKKRLQKVNCEQ